MKMTMTKVKMLSNHGGREGRWNANEDVRIEDLHDPKKIG